MSRECPNCHHQIPIFRRRLVVRSESKSGSRWSSFAPKRRLYCPHCDLELKYQLLPLGLVLFILAIAIMELARRHVLGPSPVTFCVMVLTALFLLFAMMQWGYKFVLRQYPGKGHVPISYDRIFTTQASPPSVENNQHADECRPPETKPPAVISMILAR
jgi:hypothetical protein